MFVERRLVLEKKSAVHVSEKKKSLPIFENQFRHAYLVENTHTHTHHTHTHHTHTHTTHTYTHARTHTHTVLMACAQFISELHSKLSEVKRLQKRLTVGILLVSQNAPAVPVLCYWLTDGPRGTLYKFK
jgi:hypothetical protein